MPIESTYQDHNTINDLIGKPPGWLLRSGISMIAMVTLTILTTSYFISYPDKITGNGILSSETPPIEIVAKANGYIDSILVDNGLLIEEGTTLLTIHNTTNSEELKTFKAWIELYEKSKQIKSILKIVFPHGLQLGIIQNDYAHLEIQFAELQKTIRDNLVFQQIKNLNRENDKIKELNESIRRELTIYEKELNLSRRNHARNKALKKEGAVSELDVERSETQVLQMERQFESMKNGIIQNNIRIEQLNIEVTKLKKKRKDEIKRLQLTIQEIITRTKTSIEEWSNQYELKSSLGGIVHYKNSIVKNRTIISGDVIGYILPDHGIDKYITAKVSSLNFGKLEIGQKVLIKLDAYPYKEYGMLELTLDDLNHVPVLVDDKQFYEVRMNLPQLMMTDYQNEISYSPMMSCMVEIITEDRNLLSRIFDQFISLLKNVRNF